MVAFGIEPGCLSDCRRPVPRSCAPYPLDGDDPRNKTPWYVQLFRHLPRSRSAERGPVFADTRVPIQALFDYVEAGHVLAEFLDDFPTATQAQALAALKHAREAVLSDATSSG